MNEVTSEKGKSKNSSVFMTSWKFCKANLWDLLCSSLQACVSIWQKVSKYTLSHFFQKIEKLPAKLLMPKQFVGCSCLIKNLQQASRTVDICSKEEAGKSTWKIKQQKIHQLFFSPIVKINKNFFKQKCWYSR